MLAVESRARRACVKLVDFSLCAALPVSGVRHTVGTQAFMPPEMVARLPHHASCDVWSLGILISVLLLGSPPPSASRFDALCLPQLGRPPLLAADVPAATFVARCCALLPAQRPAPAQLAADPWLQQACSPAHLWQLVRAVFTTHAINNVIGGI